MIERLRHNCVLGYVFLIGCVGCFVSTIASGQTLPDGKGKAEFERVCASCHAASMATHTGRTAEEWRGVVNDMVSRGAQGSSSDIDSVISYLSTYFGPGKGGTGSAPSAGATVPQTQPAVVLSSDQIERAKRVIAQNGCTACHRSGDEGSFIGPGLNGIGSRLKPEQIRASIVQPAPKVQPSNRQVRLVEADGKVVTGKLLNQDGYSVQIIDASGHLASHSKARLKEFTIMDENPMPSFGGKISGQDLDDLVGYLGSLIEPGK